MIERVAADGEHPPAAAVAGGRVMRDRLRDTERIRHDERDDVRDRADGHRDGDHEPVIAVDQGELTQHEPGKVGRAGVDGADVDGGILHLPVAAGGHPLER